MTKPTTTLPSPRTGYAKTNGLELYYEDHGDPKGKPIVLVMGLAAQLIYWPDPFVELLLDRGYRVIRFDNRDIGMSTKLTTKDYDKLPTAFVKKARGKRVTSAYTLYDMVEDTAGLLDHLAIPAVHIVGASMGGMIAQLFAALYRDRTLSLTSIMSSTLHPSLPWPRLDVMARIGLIGRRGQGGREDYVRQTVEVYRAIHGRGFPFPADAVGDRAGRAFDRGYNPRGAERQSVAITTTDTFEALLGRVRAPTLVIHGNRDPLVSVKGGRATAHAIAHSRLEVIDGMGHFLHEQHLPMFADWITALA